jgi:hypothetical protein
MMLDRVVAVSMAGDAVCERRGCEGDGLEGAGTADQGGEEEDEPGRADDPLARPPGWCKDFCLLDVALLAAAE